MFTPVSVVRGEKRGENDGTFLPDDRNLFPVLSLGSAFSFVLSVILRYSIKLERISLSPPPPIFVVAVISIP